MERRTPPPVQVTVAASVLWPVHQPVRSASVGEALGAFVVVAAGGGDFGDVRVGGGGADVCGGAVAG